MFILLTYLLISPEGNIFSVISCMAYLLYTLFFYYEFCVVYVILEC